MRKPIIITIALLSMVPSFSFPEEAPETNEPLEQHAEESQEATQPYLAAEEAEQSTEAQPEEPEQQEEQQEPEHDSPTETEAPAEEQQEIPQYSPAATETPTEAPEAPAEPNSFTIPAEPEPMADEVVIVPENEPELENVGINTISLDNPQGNWLFKRIWWERAEERYEKIRDLVLAIWESRTTFFVKRNELDRNVLEPFYLNVGIGQGELQVILREINDFLEKKREQQGELNEQERMLYESYATEEETLKQLELDVQSIANLDHSIDDALGTLMDQINRVRQFEDQAWQNFREIARILDDTKARELYYMIEGAARNIKNISSYLNRDFFNHFNTLTSEAAKHVSKVQKQIEALKEKGISFKRQVDLLKQTEQVQQEEDEEEDVAPKPKLSWFGWIMSGLQNALNMVVSVIMIPYNMLFGK